MATKQKIAISIPEYMLSLLDKLSQEQSASRSKIIVRSLEEYFSKLREEEVAKSYDMVFSDKKMQEEQKEWSESMMRSFSKKNHD